MKITKTAFLILTVLFMSTLSISPLAHIYTDITTDAERVMYYFTEGHHITPLDGGPLDPEEFRPEVLVYACEKPEDESERINCEAVAEIPKAVIKDFVNEWNEVAHKNEENKAIATIGGKIFLITGAVLFAAALVVLLLSFLAVPLVGLFAKAFGIAGGIGFAAMMLGGTALTLAQTDFFDSRGYQWTGVAVGVVREGEQMEMFTNFIETHGRKLAIDSHIEVVPPAPLDLDTSTDTRAILPTF